MTQTIKWTCDGCDAGIDATRIVAGEHGTDWQFVRIEVSGSTKSYGNGEWRVHLCPSCFSSLSNHVNPKRWPRAAGAAAQ